MKPYIGDKDLGADVEILDRDSYVFNGGKVIPRVKVTAKDGTKLVEGVDYRLDVKHGEHAGTAEVVITALAGKDGKGRYKVNTTNEENYFTIHQADIKNVFLKNEETYTGEKIYLDAGKNAPNVWLKNADGTEVDVTKLFKSTTATASYKNNLNAGDASVTVNVADNWKHDFTASSANVTFKISPAPVTEVDNNKFLVYRDGKDGKGHIIDFKGFEGLDYTGEPRTFKDAKIDVTTKLNKKDYTLEKGKDYTIEYACNTYPDVTGNNGKTAYVWAKLSSNFVLVDKSGKKVDATLKTQDGTLTNVLASHSYRINARTLENAAVSVTNAVYNGGKEVTPTVNVTVDGKNLTEDTDYVLTYEKDETYNATKENSKLVTVKGINGYVASSKTVKWGIDAKDIASDSVKVTLDKKSYKANEKPEVTVADGKTILDADEYSVAYTDMEKGVLTITGEGKNYTGSKTVTFNIVEETPLVGAPVITNMEVYGNNVDLILSGDVEGASGYDYVISASKDPSDKDARLDVVKNQVQTTANFKYVPQGTYYAYCHAWTRDENGKKVFGEWSNSYAFSVTAITPDTPEILSVETKGSTITVTYKESANSTGYDVVLGKGSKKEHGETRPYQYGTYKKLNVKPGVCKAVFKNVPAGTYYAGVHSWNRTASENNNKVFSKWSNLETAKVK